MDEIKHFFNQLDSLKTQFKPWTSKLKQALKLDEIDNFKDEPVEPVNNEDVFLHFQHVSFTSAYLNLKWEWAFALLY